MIKNILFILLAIGFSRDLEVNFTSEDPWLAGHRWASGIAFDNGITYGLGVYGNSSVGSDQAIDVEIHFSEHPDSISNSMVFSSLSFGEASRRASFMIFKSIPR